MSDIKSRLYVLTNHGEDNIWRTAKEALDTLYEKDAEIARLRFRGTSTAHDFVHPANEGDWYCALCGEHIRVHAERMKALSTLSVEHEEIIRLQKQRDGGVAEQTSDSLTARLVGFHFQYVNRADMGTIFDEAFHEIHRLRAANTRLERESTQRLAAFKSVLSNKNYAGTWRLDDNHNLCREVDGVLVPKQIASALLEDE